MHRMKQMNMQKYFLTSLNISLKTWSQHSFLKYWKYFPLETIFFFLLKSSITGFSCLKNIYIYTFKKKWIKNWVFFCTCSHRVWEGANKIATLRRLPSIWQTEKLQNYWFNNLPKKYSALMYSSRKYVFSH